MKDIFLLFCLCVSILLVLIVLVVNVFSSRTSKKDVEDTSYIEESFQTDSHIKPWTKAGQYGEKVVGEMIRTILRKEDQLYTNVRVQFAQREAEIDNIIINQNGIFVIEVKNYSGVLKGTAQDLVWKKCKTTRETSFEKEIENPLRQMRRQVYILASFLKRNGIKVWVDGYVMFVQRNSPFQGEEILETAEDIDNVIHQGKRNRLCEDERKEIDFLLKNATFKKMNLL